MKQRVGIYGGTFSPIHVGHYQAALTFLEQMALDRLYVIPTAEPPHKCCADGASAADRLTMVHLAFEDCEAYRSGRLAVSDFEIRREGKSYSIYTLEHFAAADRELFMLCGTDMFLTLPEWKRAGDIFRLADIVLMRRESEAQMKEEIRESWERYEREFGARIHELKGLPVVLSSTGLRRRLRDGESVEGLIPQKAAQYIAHNNLYR